MTRHANLNRPSYAAVHEARPFGELMRRIRALGHFARADRMPDDDEVKSLVVGSQLAQDAVASYQDYHGLIVDGEIGPITEAHMSLPRCGLPDYMPARGCTPKWADHDVTYSHRLSFGSMSVGDIHAAVVQACEQWNAVCGLKLRFQQEMSTANIWMEARPIDRAGGTLAWSYMPSCGAKSGERLQQRYDTRERWDVDFLVAVVCHEVGHAIGLDHTNQPGNLMNPFYDRSVTKPQASWDIPSVVSRYGEPESSKPTPPTPPAGDGYGTVSIAITAPEAGVYSLSIPLKRAA